MTRPFTEIQHVQQTAGEPRKRWFQSDYFDLFVWYEEDDSLWGFRLCYDRCFDEHSLTWRPDTNGVRHHSIDEDAGEGMLGASPWLSESRDPVPPEAIARFEEEGRTLPDDLRTLIREVLLAAVKRN